MHSLSVKRPQLPRYGWYLYDFGNSILIINGGLYFPQWLAKQSPFGDILYNLIFVCSSILLLLTAPLFGLLADRNHASIRYLALGSAVLAISSFCVGFSPYVPHGTVRLAVASLGFFLVLVSYQLCLVFYNAFLARISAPSDYEKISARGLAWGWCGGVAGIFLGLLFSKISHSDSGMTALPPTALIMSVSMIASIYLISRIPPDADVGSKIAPATTASDLKNELLLLKGNPSILAFLCSYLLFSDAILTIQNNSTIYMDAVLHFEDSQKALEFLLILVTSALGALASAQLAPIFGLKRLLIAVLSICAAVVFVGPQFNTRLSVSIVFGLLGLLNGCVWNCSRVLFMQLIPKQRRNTFFGFYSTFERFASILGPMVWLIPIATVSAEPLKYQLAWMSMSVFLLASIIFLYRVVAPASPVGNLS